MESCVPSPPGWLDPYDIAKGIPVFASSSGIAVGCLAGHMPIRLIDPRSQPGSEAVNAVRRSAWVAIT